jgi:hypothetical protein
MTLVVVEIRARDTRPWILMIVPEGEQQWLREQ